MSESLRETSSSELSCRSVDHRRNDSDPLHFQCIYTHPYALVCIDVIISLELGVDNVNELVDFNADVITSLLVVFCPLAQPSEAIRTVSDSS
jgi:hypothetical protein